MSHGLVSGKLSAFAGFASLRDFDLQLGSVGLCKFRNTEAEFRHFRIGADLAPATLPDDQLAKLEAHVERLASTNFAEEFEMRL